MSPAPRRLLTFALCLFPGTVFAQASITTAAPSAVPVGGPWVVPLLALILIAGAWWMIRSRGLRPGVASVALALAIAVGTAGVLRALAIDFTNPNGETILLPFEVEEGEGFIIEWDPVDFTNSSGQPLQIVGIVAPEFIECAPEDGFDDLADPDPDPDPSPYPICEVDQVLAAGETCRVDVDAMCREAALTGMATLTHVDPSSGGVPGGDEVVIHGTNLSTTTYVEFGGTPVGDENILEATDTWVRVRTPARAAGTYYVFVATRVGAVMLNNAFTYVAGL